MRKNTAYLPGALPVLLAGAYLFTTAPSGWSAQAQAPAPSTPTVVVRDAPGLRLRGANSTDPAKPGDTDCNSPAHWDGSTLYVFHSAGHPWRSSGPGLLHLDQGYVRTEYNNRTNGGRWIESTWKPPHGDLYGWYHFEPTGLCPGTHLTAPRIGAVRSSDNGAHWQDLGVVLEAPAGTLQCTTSNYYFAGGNGDFSVIADPESEYLYFLISTYAGPVTEQGVGIARIRRADLDTPVGRVWKWHQGSWSAPGLGGHVTPVWQVRQDWHRPDVDAFWGPSVHWNTHLKQHVILLNRAVNSRWAQEGVYVSFASRLDQPGNWSAPVKILGGLGPEQWYPQVIGGGQGETDKLAGAKARLFVRGDSRWELQFFKPGEGH